MKASANSVRRKDYGYQRSADLIEAGQRLNLFKGILSCIGGKTTWTKAVTRLAELTSTNLEEMENLTYAEARTRTHKAREHLSKVQKEDGENQIKWLEGKAHSNFLENPKGTFDSFLKQMISAAKQMQLNRKLKRILKPE